MKNFLKIFLLLIQFSWMSHAQQFEVVSTVPSTTTIGINISQNISITFSEAVNNSNRATFPKVYVNKSTTPVSGAWTVSNSNKTITFNANANYPYGGYVRVKLNPAMRSASNRLLYADYTIFNKAAKRYDYGFLVNYQSSYTTVTDPFENIAPRTVAGVSHNLTLKITYPVGATEKTPVHLYVHGGAWNGGTITKSNSWSSPYDEYLAKNLGIASVNISYRCRGSNGTFTQAMQDIKSAYDWVLANANTFNLDTTKMFFSGGSAGTPLASLSSQRLPVKAFIGFNGKYDFVNEVSDNFPPNNYDYQSSVPSATANSAISNLTSPPPPTLLLHGDNDISINIRQSQAFATAVRQGGSIAKLVTYPGEPHAFFYPAFEEFGDTAYEMAQFLKGLGLNVGGLQSGNFYLNNVGANRRLKSNTNNTDAITTGVADNGWKGLWKFVDAGNGYFFIQNQASGNRLQGTSSNTATQTSVKLVSGTYNGTWVQWKLTPVNGNWYIDNKAHNTRLSVNGSGEIIVGTTGWTGTWGQWKLTNQSSAKGSVAKDSKSETITDTSRILIYPNSITAGEDFNLHYTSEENDNVLQIRIIDTSGKILINTKQSLNNGMNKLEVNSKGLSQGLYFVELSSKGKRNTKKIVIK